MSNGTSVTEEFFWTNGNIYGTGDLIIERNCQGTWMESQATGELKIFIYGNVTYNLPVIPMTAEIAVIGSFHIRS